MIRPAPPAPLREFHEERTNVGVYIHYDGKSLEPENLPELLDGMERIGQAFGWKTTRISRQISGLKPKVMVIGDGPTRIEGLRLVEDTVTGIVFDTGEAGAFEIAFNSEGMIGDYMDISHFLEGTENEGETCWYFGPLWACLTGFPDTHRSVCTLLRFMEKTHRFTDWEISDGTGYYESGNEGRLIEEHAIHGSFKRMMSDPADAKAFLVATGIVSADAEVTPVDQMPPPKRKPKAKSARAARPN